MVDFFTKGNLQPTLITRVYNQRGKQLKCSRQPNNGLKSQLSDDFEWTTLICHLELYKWALHSLFLSFFSGLLFGQLRAPLAAVRQDLPAECGVDVPERDFLPGKVWTEGFLV